MQILAFNLLWTLSCSYGDEIQNLKPEFEVKSGSSTVNHLAEFYIPTLSHAFLESLVNTSTYVVLLSIQPLNHAPTHAEYSSLYWTRTNKNHTILDDSCHPISVLTFFNIIPFGVKFGRKWYKNIQSAVTNDTYKFTVKMIFTKQWYHPQLRPQTLTQAFTVLGRVKASLTQTFSMVHTLLTVWEQARWSPWTRMYNHVL